MMLRVKQTTRAAGYPGNGFSKWLCASCRIKISRPRASPFGHNLRAVNWLMIATGAPERASSAVKLRPSRIGISNKEKNCGETWLYQTHGVFAFSPAEIETAGRMPLSGMDDAAAIACTVESDLS